MLIPVFENVVLKSSETLSYVAQLKMVEEFNEAVTKSKLQKLFEKFGSEFDHAPAATTKHHNFTHGLLIHTAEVWQTAQLFHRVAPASASYSGLCDGSQFSLAELFVSVALHDFAKIMQYVPSANNSWKRTNMICNQEVWTLNECAKLGISLTDNELVGLLHAEGGYTEYEVDWRPLSALVHAADLWSSQAMRCFWDPAKEAGVVCPKCKLPMSLRSGKMGDFYGCTGYPTCNGIVNMREAPDVSKVFVSFLQKNYPVA